MSKENIYTRSDANGKNNEDAYFTCFQGDKAILCVCDGVGGTDAGEVASGYVTKALETWLEKNDTSKMGVKTLHNEISLFIENMHLDLESHADKRRAEGDSEYSLGTTFVLAVIGRDAAVIENIGDSRCYICQRGYLKQVTVDQTVKAYEQCGGFAVHVDERFVNLTEKRKSSVLLQCIGDCDSVPEPATFVQQLDEEVDILLCSDGLSNKLNELNFQSQLTKKQDGKKAIDNLISLAKKRGEKDNITALLFRRRK